MKYEIDIESLRKDLINYFGTAMYNASPLAIIDLVKIEKATPEELINIANKNNIDLNNYIYNSKSRY